MTPWLHPWL